MKDIVKYTNGYLEQLSFKFKWIVADTESLFVAENSWSSVDVELLANNAAATHIK